MVEHTEIYSMAYDFIRPEHYKTLKQLLSSSELNSIEPLHENRQNEFTLSRGFLRLILSKKLNIPANKIVIETNPQGKPYVGHDIEFNISHCYAHLLIALSQKPIGIDIEYTLRKKDWKKLSKRFFHADEQKQMNNSDDFYHIWTRKESFLKCLGSGITKELSKINVLEDKISFEGKEYYFSKLTLPTHYIGHLCSTEATAYSIKELKDVKWI